MGSNFSDSSYLKGAKTLTGISRRTPGWVGWEKWRKKFAEPCQHLQTNPKPWMAEMGERRKLQTPPVCKNNENDKIGHETGAFLWTRELVLLTSVVPCISVSEPYFWNTATHCWHMPSGTYEPQILVLPSIPFPPPECQQTPASKSSDWLHLAEPLFFPLCLPTQHLLTRYFCNKGLASKLLCSKEHT